MKTISLLNLTKNKFNTLSFLQKVELYIFPLLVLYLIFFLLDKNKTRKVEVNDVKQIIENKIYKINTSKYKGSLVDIQKDLNTFARKFKIKIISLNTNKNIVFIKVKTSSSKLISLIEFCENYNDFSFLSDIIIEKETNSKLIISKLKIDFNKYFIKSNLKEEFKINKTKKKLLLKAIVFDNININDKWLKVGDKINGYILKKINNQNQVILEKESKTILLRIYDYEKNTELYN